LDYYSLIDKIDNDRFMNTMKQRFGYFVEFDKNHIFKFYYNDYI